MCPIPSDLGIPRRDAQNTNRVKEGQRLSLNSIAVLLSHFGDFLQDQKKKTINEDGNLTNVPNTRRACNSQAI